MFTKVEKNRKIGRSKIGNNRTITRTREGRPSGSLKSQRVANAAWLIIQAKNRQSSFFAAQFLVSVKGLTRPKNIPIKLSLARTIWGHIWGHISKSYSYNVSIIDTYRLNLSLLGAPKFNIFQCLTNRFGTKSILYVVPKLRPTVWDDIKFLLSDQY